MAKQFLTPIDMNKLEILNPRLQNLAAAPSSPVEGQVYYDNDTGDKQPYFWNGSTWVSMSSASPAIDWAEAADLIAIGIADTADAGTSIEVPRADHRHAGPGFGSVTSETGFGQASGNGSATTVARSDHTHGTPTLPSYATTTELADVDAAAEAAGTSATIARGDHKHALSVAAPSASAVADTQAAGTANSAARSDHRHAREAFGNVTAQTSFGASSANGTATTIPHSDHTHGTPTHDTAAHSAVSHSGLSAPTADVAWGGFKITNLGTPTAGTDAATKAYVDNSVQGLDAKASVRAATTAAGTLATSFENADVIDGVTLATGDRILIKDQAAPADNGIYTVNATGAPTRAADADTWGEIISAFVWVEEGTTNGDTGWVSTANAGGTLGTTAMPWVQFTGAAQITAGAGLTKTGNTLDVGAGTGITVNADDVQVTRTDANGRVPLLYAANVGNASATTFNIDHNLNTKDCIVQIYRVSDGVDVFCDVTRSTVNRVILDFASAPASNAYRVVIHA